MSKPNFSPTLFTDGLPEEQTAQRPQEPVLLL